jgi:hypothetical protein
MPVITTIWVTAEFPLLRDVPWTVQSAGHRGFDLFELPQTGQSNVRPTRRKFANHPSVTLDADL